MSTSLVPQETPGDIVLALLQVDPELGCCDRALRHVREDMSIRHTLASRLLQPEIRRHRVLVDYDAHTPARLMPLIAPEHTHGLTAESFRVSRTGRQEMFVDEVFIGRSMSTRQQMAFIAAMKRRTLCVAEALATLDSVLHTVTYPVMAHCDQDFRMFGPNEAIPALLHTQAQRIATACRSDSRWSQDYRLLMTADAA